MKKIDICIATYKRPALLAELLSSLTKQSLEDGLTLRIIIIDNDVEKSALQIAKNFEHLFPENLVYFVEKQKGLSYVRNRAMQYIKSDFFAFLDDDETVEKFWLKKMYNTMIEKNADVVFGPVISIFPELAPEWARKNPCFNRKRKKTGDLVKTGATGNVLIRTKSLRFSNTFFDANYALTGGEDTEFFHKLYLLGKKLVWCNEGIAYEKVHLSRLTQKWILLRSFRKGQSFGRTFVKRYNFAKKFKWLIVKLFQILLSFLTLPILRATSYKDYFLLKCKIYEKIGQLSYLAGRFIHYKEYL